MDMIRILAVDDEPDLRSLLRILLKNKGYEVLEAASGREAVEKVRSEPRIDLVIMDIMMPGLSGVEACAEIRKFSTVPMLFLTAKSQLSDKAEAYASGGDDYLAKPFSQGELLGPMGTGLLLCGRLPSFLLTVTPTRFSPRRFFRAYSTKNLLPLPPAA